ncbi:unnamed protein product, partial [Scytosiphon promiscuus]
RERERSLHGSGDGAATTAAAAAAAPAVVARRSKSKGGAVSAAGANGEAGPKRNGLEEAGRRGVEVGACVDGVSSPGGGGGGGGGRGKRPRRSGGGGGPDALVPPGEVRKKSKGAEEQTDGTESRTAAPKPTSAPKPATPIEAARSRAGGAATDVDGGG